MLQYFLNILKSIFRNLIPEQKLCVVDTNSHQQNIKYCIRNTILYIRWKKDMSSSQQNITYNRSSSEHI